MSAALQVVDDGIKAATESPTASCCMGLLRGPNLVCTWVAGYAALGAAGSFTVQHSYYRPIRELIAGFGLTTVTHD